MVVVKQEDYKTAKAVIKTERTIQDLQQWVKAMKESFTNEEMSFYHDVKERDA